MLKTEQSLEVLDALRRVGRAWRPARARCGTGQAGTGQESRVAVMVEMALVVVGLAVAWIVGVTVLGALLE